MDMEPTATRRAATNLSQRSFRIRAPDAQDALLYVAPESIDNRQVADSNWEGHWMVPATNGEAHIFEKDLLLPSDRNYLVFCLAGGQVIDPFSGTARRVEIQVHIEGREEPVTQAFGFRVGY